MNKYVMIKIQYVKICGIKNEMGEILEKFINRKILILY